MSPFSPSLRVQRLAVAVQILILTASLIAPVTTLAADPEPDPSASPTTTEPEASPEPEPTPQATPDATPEPEATSEPESTPEPEATPDATPEPVDSPEPEPSAPAPSVPYLVRFAASTPALTRSVVLAAAGAEDVSYIAPLAIHAVLLPDGDGLASSIDTLTTASSVVSVEPDRTREVDADPGDTSYADQWSLPRIGWDNVFGTVSPAGTATVAILDTGIDGSHPDLDANLLSGTSILDGSNGLTDPNGHGTAMAGIVAAETDNGLGVAGIGYAGVSVLPVTVLGPDGTGQDSDIIAGVVWAADHDADVILMAFSNPGYSELLQAAIDYAWDQGAVLVAATGNDASSSVTFPAGDRGVIGVSNTDESDALNSSSNHGQAVFLGAPGTNIATTDVGGYTSVTGTSPAAAEVAGAAALLRAADSSASNGVVVSRLARNAAAAGTAAETGNGRLNLDRALADTSEDSIQPAGAPPVGPGGPMVGPYAAAACTLNDFTLSSQTPPSVTAGSSATFTFTLTKSNGSCGPITLSAATALPAGAAPIFASTSGDGTFTQTGSPVGTTASWDNLGGASSRPVTLTISTTGGTTPAGSFPFTVLADGPNSGGQRIGDDQSDDETLVVIAATGQVELQKDFVGAPDNVTLRIGTTQNGSQTDSQALAGDGTTGQNSVAVGTYFVSEVLIDPGAFSVALACFNDNNHNDVVDAGDTTHSVNASTGQLSIAAGEDVICVFTNSRKPQLRVIKDLGPDGDPGRFDLIVGGLLFDNGGAGFGDTATGTGFQTFTAGLQQVVSEVQHPGTLLADYVTSISCDNGDTNLPFGGSSLTTSTLDNGDVVTCTITNSHKPQLRVIKDLGPDGDPGRFDLIVGGLLFDNGGAGFGDTATGTGFQTFTAGLQQVVSEVQHPGTLLADYVTSISCDNGDTNLPFGGSSLTTSTLDNGDVVTCTITNSHKPQLRVIKDLGPDGDPGRFDLIVGGLLFDNGGAGFGDTATGTGFQTFTAGLQQVVSEVQHPGTLLADYVTSISCDNGDTNLPFGGSSLTTSTLDNGDVVTCTITNTHKPRLTVTKVLPNDNGGTATCDEFVFQVNGGADVAFEADCTNELTVDAGTYTVTESEQAGYTATYSAECSGTAVVGGQYACEISNDDQAATLTVTKVLPNDNGGAATCDDFVFQVNGGADVPFEADCTNELTVDAGTYTVTESEQAGYTASYAGCEDVVLVPGGAATCEITNDDQASTLTVTKVLPNDNGGTATCDDFAFQVNGGADVPFEADCTNELTVDAGTYTVTETEQAGYTASYVGCTSVVLGLGGSATCEITNDDQPPQLRVIKVVEPDGDTGLFDLMIDGIIYDNGGAGFGDTATGTGFQTTFIAGAAHTVNEQAHPGTGTDLADYVSSVSCDNGDTNTGTGGGPLLVTSALDNGDVVTCTITNTHKPQLRVIKVVEPDGDTGLFDLMIDGIIYDNGGAGFGDTATGTGFQTTFIAGAAHTVNEQAHPGTGTDLADYVSSVSCDNGDTNTGTGGGPLLVTSALDNGDVVTCTITNTHKPQLRVIKVVEPDGDTGLFDLMIDGIIYDNGGAGFGDTATGTGFQTTFIAGAAHTVNEQAHPGTGTDLADYVSSVSCDNGDTNTGTGGGPLLVTSALDNGDVVTCTITNTRGTGTITVAKTVTGPAEADARFDLRVDGTIVADETASGSSSSPQTVTTGNRTVSETADGETNLADYASSISCVESVAGGINGASPVTLGSAGPATVPVAAGDAWTCTFTNARNTGRIELQKDFIGGADDVTLRIGTTQNGSEVDSEALIADGTTGENTVATGTFFVSEALSNAADFDVSLACYFDTNDSDTVDGGDILHAVDALTGAVVVNSNDDVLCVFTNARRPTLTVTKIVVGGAGGQTFDLDIDGTTHAEDQGDGGSTGLVVLATGPHTISETFGDESAVTGFDVTFIGDCAPDGNVTLGYGQDATCTIVNSRIPLLRVAKAFFPADDPGTVSLTINGGIVPDPELDGWGHGQTTPFQPAFLTGNSASEAGFGTFDLGHYDTTWSCNDAAATSGTGTSISGLDLAYGEAVTCTFLNQRKPELRLMKVFYPADDPGRVSFTINGVIAPDLDGFGHGEATAFAEAQFQDNTASEAGFAPTVLAGHYDSTWSCDDAANTSGTGTEITVADDLDLGYGDRVTCTFTNNRLPLIRFAKDFDPADPHSVYFTLNGPIVSDADGVADGETTDWFVANLTGNLITENAFGLYDLPGGYASSYSCDDAAGTSGAGTTISGLDLAYGEEVTCTFTNERRPTLTVIKHIVNDNGGTATAPQWTLTVTSSNGGTGTGSAPGAESPGTSYTLQEGKQYSVTESGGPSGYTASPSTDCLITSAVAGATYICTITNDDIQPILTIVKDISPNSDPGRFNLLVNGGPVATNIGDGYSTGPLGVNAGLVTVSETGGTIPPTNLANYASTIDCGSGPQNGASLAITLQVGDVVTCTLTNTANDGDGDNIPDFLDCSSLPENRVVDPAGTLTLYLPPSRIHATLQAAVNAAVDNDVIGMYANTTENVVIGGAGSGGKDLRIVGCGRKITAAVATSPVVKILSSAGANDGNTGNGEADIHIDDLDVQKGSIGYWMQTSTNGSNHTFTLLKAIRSDMNGPGNGTGTPTGANPGIGVKIEGDGNKVRGANSIGTNAGDGINVNGKANVLESNRVTKSKGDGIDVTGNANHLNANKVGEKGVGNKQNGIKVAGNTNILEENDVFGNTLRGIDVCGDQNQVSKNDVGEKDKGNAGGGIRLQGNGNLLGKDLAENNVFANGGIGIEVVGNTNSIKKNDVGDSGKGNSGDGINIRGYGNVIDENNVFANGGDGIDVSGGTAAAPNLITRNDVGDRNKGNLGYGIVVGIACSDVGNGTAGPIEIAENTVISNKLHGIKVTGGGHQLANNTSGGSGAYPAGSDNGDYEFLVGSGNFNAGGNKANGTTIPGAVNSPFPTAGQGTP